MHDKKRDLLWQTRIITEVYFFVVLRSRRRTLAGSEECQGAPDCDYKSPVQDNDGSFTNTLLWWYVFVKVGRVFCHACTSMTILWQNQDSRTCAVVEVFHDITEIIITEVSTSMMINRASQKCFRQGWPTRGIHHNGTPLSYRVGFWIR